MTEFKNYTSEIIYPIVKRQKRNYMPTSFGWTIWSQFFWPERRWTRLKIREVRLVIKFSSRLNCKLDIQKLEYKIIKYANKACKILIFKVIFKDQTSIRSFRKVASIQNIVD